jgi:hypothetical protein
VRQRWSRPLSFPTWLLPSAVVEECVAVEVVGSMVAGWAAVSGAVGWVAVFAGVQSVVASGEGR